MMTRGFRLATWTRQSLSLAWWVMAVMCFVVAIGSAARYWALDAERFFPEQRAVYVQHLLSMYGHTLVSPISLLLGPLQFHEGLRSRWPRAHRIFGIAYLGTVFIGGLGGLTLSAVAFGRWPTRLGFALLAVLWLVSAAMTLYHVKRRDLLRHRQWAMRNFSLTFAAVMLRVWVPLLTSLPGMTFGSAYAMAAWISWLPNLIAVEWLLRVAPAVDFSRRCDSGSGQH
jgi:hypothetical protein